MAQSPKNDSGMVPRSYQLELLDDIKKSNTILYLPTGCGKTFIAALLIKDMGECLTKPIGNGRKWTFFIVPCIPLVSQQASNLGRHLSWNIGTFSGDDKGFDFRSKEQWDKILKKYQILVMTAQLFLNNLSHGYMHLKDVNLLIFDECHHAVALHPYRQIMEVLHNSNLKSDERPHILGLTATLINSKSKNVKDDLHKLEITLDSTIKTKYDKNIQKFSAHPKECVCLYGEHILDNELLVVRYRISKIVNYLVTIQDKSKNKTELETSIICELRNKDDQLENYFRDIELSLNDGGAYIAYLNSLHFMMEVKKKQKICQDVERSDIMSLVLSELTIIRKMLYDYMNKHSIIHEDHSTTLQNVSPKVKKLMEILSALKATDSCLVFVLRRTTAKILYRYINDYVQEYNQKNIVCEFVVGGRGIFGDDCKENNYKKPQNIEIIKKFNSNITNVLITSQVLEEGIDIQICNVVIRYDCPNNFTSYVQSKGRARSANSTFITMVPDLSRLNYMGIQNGFNEMEKEIKKILAVNSIEDEDDNDSYHENNMSIMFKTGHGTLNYENACHILNEYYTTLPKDKFSDFKSEWYISKDENNCIKFKLTLYGVIKHPIDGIFCANKKDAKKSAAFNACLELYKVGALDDYLKPMGIENNDCAILNDLEWFPHWDEKDIEHGNCNFKPGCHKTTKIVHSETLTYLYGSYPQVNKPSYLHVIHCVPDYTQLKESKYEAFDKLLKTMKEFGILTSKKLPQVSSFPIFLHFGIVNVSIKVNVNVIYTDHTTLKKLDNFHNKLFMDVLGVNNFFARSYDNEDNSYLVVPIFLTDGIYFLDWDVISIDKFVETDEKPTMEQRKTKLYEKYLGSINVISQSYKNESPVQRYILTDVYMDMTPESSFETSEYDTYAKYFSDNYNINVSHTNQPLIKVMSLDVSKINYLTPRRSLPKPCKKTEHDDILIPEFCTWHEFPSDYWLKALMLPTILYRLEKLLLAEEIYAKINSMCNMVVEGNTNKDSLKIDNCFAFNECQNENIVKEISETSEYTLNNMDEVLEFDPNNFPKDIERIRNIIMSDHQNYRTFMYDQSEGNYNIKHQESNSSSRIKEQIDKVLKIEWNEMNPLNLTNNPPPILSPLIKEDSKQNKRPEQSDILKAITLPKAKDLFSYECMETYGDSFLKFATGLVLFDAFPIHDEGALTILRTKIVGNQNLYYVGRNLNILSYMVNYFDPNMAWIPPCFGVPKKIKDTIEDNNISPDVVYEIIIPKDNQITGILSDDTWTKIKNKILTFKKCSRYNSYKNYISKIGNFESDLFINKKSFSDKMVADCVESLIGTYVYKCGVEVGFKVIHGLGIIPEQFIDTFKPKPIKNVRNDLNISKILPGYEILEQRIGYSFKHKHLLVEALTHPTNEFALSECYQRLEFLGDAIIDFLITSYIMEHKNPKTPGEITIIRSSLVNNRTIGSLSARIGLHKFVLVNSLAISEAIDHFYKYFQKNNYRIGQEVFCLVEENDCYAGEFIEVPKILGDLFESLIAAIYLDCNRDLNVVWTIFYRFLEKEINEFCNNVPKNSIDILYRSNLQPIFSKPDIADPELYKRLGTMIQLKIHSNQKSLTVYGFGHGKKEAKTAAAQLALKNIKKMS